MLVRSAIIWALLNIGCLIREIMEYRKSKRWGWKGWLEYHISGLTRFVISINKVLILAAIVYWVLTGFKLKIL